MTIGKRIFAGAAVFLLSLAVIVFAGHNAWELRRELGWNLESGFRNIEAGREFLAQDDIAPELLAFVEETVSPGGSGFYWTIPDLRGEVSTECRAIEWNYYLYPRRVLYLDDSKLLDSDFIVCDGAFDSWLKRRLLEISLVTGEEMEFKKEASDGKSSIFLRKR